LMRLCLSLLKGDSMPTGINVLSLIDSFEVKRAKDIDVDLLKSMKGPVIDEIEQRNIIDFFTSKEYLEDDKKGKLASFVVLSPDEIPLAFFSFRCGELFEETELEKMNIGYNAYIALKQLSNKEIRSEKEQEEAMKSLNLAKAEGLSFQDIAYYYDKKKTWKTDDLMDVNKDVNKVLTAYPAVELKLFGINEAAKCYWHSLKLPDEKKMGECLFWLKVVDVFQAMLNFVGCQFLYLFAADKEADGQLVQYYRVRLGFDSDAKMTANKPSFDWNSQFLFQDVDSLFRRRDLFRSSFLG